MYRTRKYRSGGNFRHIWSRLPKAFLKKKPKIIENKNNDDTYAGFGCCEIEIAHRNLKYYRNCTERWNVEPIQANRMYLNFGQVIFLSFLFLIFHFFRVSGPLSVRLKRFYFYYYSIQCFPCITNELFFVLNILYLLNNNDAFIDIYVFQQVFRHRNSHVSQTDKSDVRFPPLAPFWNKRISSRRVYNKINIVKKKKKTRQDTRHRH